jgi:exoribonuclease R
VTASNYRICFVAGGVNGRDICIPSYEYRNRALEGDIVVVEKLARDLWGIDQKKAESLGKNLACVCVCA